MPNMHLGGRPANQIAMRIECAKKAFFVTLETRFYPLKSIDRDKERIFDRCLVSPKTYSLPGSVIASTAIGKLKGHGLAIYRTPTFRAEQNCTDLPIKVSTLICERPLQPVGG